MKVKISRAARHLVARNFSARGFSRRVAALHYIPTVVMSSIDHHSVAPGIIEHVAVDLAACEALSFTGQMAIILLAPHLKNVGKASSVLRDRDIHEVTHDDSS